ncbi:MAG: ankyrin repeat domain-containing protein [Candidatus Bilamarchaeaceae archaeon]
MQRTGYGGGKGKHLKGARTDIRRPPLIEDIKGAVREAEQNLVNAVKKGDVQKAEERLGRLKGMVADYRPEELLNRTIHERGCRMTLAMHASERGDGDMLDWLLKNGADPAKEIDGRNAMAVARGGALELLRLRIRSRLHKMTGTRY